jgi:hypothetical protein
VRLGIINKAKPLDFYREEFEIVAIEDLKHFYATESSFLISNQGVSDYLKKVEVRMEEEENRAKRWLDPCSWEKVRAICLISNKLLILGAPSLLRFHAPTPFRANNPRDGNLSRR